MLNLAWVEDRHQDQAFLGEVCVGVIMLTQGDPPWRTQCYLHDSVTSRRFQDRPQAKLGLEVEVRAWIDRAGLAQKQEVL